MNKRNLCSETLFQKAFFEYAKDLKRFLFFKFKDMETAEDILQESFLKLWKNCEKVTYSKVKSYLFTIANNAFLDVKKHEKVVRDYNKSYVEQNKTVSPEFLIIEKEFYTKVERAIASLPPKQREVFIMSKIEKLKYKEIAQKLDISVKAVEKRMHQALKSFKERIDYKI